jgi:hypothetical protein
MRQFRTSTDSVFDLDTAPEGPRDVTVVNQPGPPAQESTGPQQERPADDPAED